MSQIRISLSGPLAGLSQGLETELGDPNDDLIERKARRRSRLLDDFSLNTEAAIANPSAGPSTNTNRFLNITSTDMTSHYGDCIKLATENKITLKNAFSLHLIDFIPIMMRRNEIGSFQMASSSLDAGAKIYASRVDAIHKEAYQVVTSLGRTTDKPIEGSDDDEENAGHGPEEDAGSNNEDGVEGREDAKRKKKAAISKKKKAILVNVCKIRLKAIQLQAELDPLFQQQAASYDEGGTQFLRLNNLSTINFPCELQLDSSLTVSLDNATDQQLQANPEISTEESKAIWKWNFNSSDPEQTQVLQLFQLFLECIKRWVDNRPCPLTVCPEFEEFRIQGWEPGVPPKLLNSQLDAISVTSSLPLDGPGTNAEYPMLIDEDDDVESVYQEAGNDYGGDDNYAMEPQCSDVNGPNATVYVSDTSELKMQHESMNPTKEAQEFLHLMRELCSTSGSTEHDDMFGMWAGPDLWKRKCRDLKNAKFAKPVDKAVTEDLDETKVEDVKKMTKALKRSLYIAFIDLGSHLKTNKTDSYSELDYTLIFKKGRAGIVLSQSACLAQMNTKKRVAPRHSFEAMDSGDRLLCRELDLYVLFQERQLLASVSLHNGKELDENIINDYNYHNDFDTSQFVPDGGNQALHEDGPGTGGDVQGMVEYTMMPDDDFDEDYGAPVGECAPMIGDVEDLVGLGRADEVMSNTEENRNEPEVVDDDDSQLQVMELMQPPRKIKKIEIGFARNAKRVNVKRLKMVLWMFLEPLKLRRESVPVVVNDSSQSDALAIEDSKPSPTTLQNKVKFGHIQDNNFIMLSQLVQRVPGQFNLVMAQDLSAPVVFTCLLYLANEKTLVVSNTDDHLDLYVRVGSTNVNHTALPEQDPNLYKVQEYGASHGVGPRTTKRHGENADYGRKKAFRQSTLDEFNNLDSNDLDI